MSYTHKRHLNKLDELLDFDVEDVEILEYRQKHEWSDSKTRGINGIALIRTVHEFTVAINDGRKMYVEIEEES